MSSGQEGPHRDLQRVVERHLTHPFRRPPSSAAQAAWADFRMRWDGRAPLVFDSGCGVGDSTRILAGRHADALVVGIDQSADRLSRRREPLPDNAFLLRADLVDFWRLADEEGLSLSHHYLLYPNPWPKIGHLGRRWHGHPVFPALLALGGRIELRTNWPIYATEFARALLIADGFEAARPGARPAAQGRFFWKLWIDVLGEAETSAPLTPFERKYAASGQALHRLVAERRAAPAEPGNAGRATG